MLFSNISYNNRKNNNTQGTGLMKKFSLYALAAFGVIYLVLSIASSVFRTSGATMFGSDGGRPPGGVGSVAEALSPSNQKSMAVNESQRSAAMTNAPADASVATTKRMIIRNANLTLQSDDIKNVMDSIAQLAEKSGGFVVDSNIQSDNQSDVIYSANISIRVPAQGLQNALTQLKALSTRVLSESTSGKDITQQYVDLESQLKNLETSKVQLTKIMEGAKKTEDVLNVYRELSNIQGQIDVLQGQIKYFSESAALSLINIQLVSKPVIQHDGSFSDRFMDVVKQSYVSLTNSIIGIVFGTTYFVIYLLPMLIYWGLILAAGAWIGRKVFYFIKRRL
jgi:hypothetical protein